MICNKLPILHAMFTLKDYIKKSKFGPWALVAYFVDSASAECYCFNCLAYCTTFNAGVKFFIDDNAGESLKILMLTFEILQFWVIRRRIVHIVKVLNLIPTSPLNTIPLYNFFVHCRQTSCGHELLETRR